jgi:hypothetical protein
MGIIFLKDNNIPSTLFGLDAFHIIIPENSYFFWLRVNGEKSSLQAELICTRKQQK